MWKCELSHGELSPNGHFLYNQNIMNAHMKFNVDKMLAHTTSNQNFSPQISFLECWWLRVKWHRTYKTHKRQTGHHSGQRNRTAQASLRFILYSFPGQNSRLYGEAFSVERVCMISYSKREWNCGLLQSLSRALSSSPSQEGNDKEESVPLFARDH